MRVSFFVLLAAMTSVGCSTTTVTDAGEADADVRDASPDAGRDGSTPDAGRDAAVTVDAGEDATIEVDASLADAGVDATVPSDAGTDAGMDAGTDAATTPGDAGLDATAPVDGGGPVIADAAVTPPATTFADVHPIFVAHCTPCHRTGGSGGHNIASASVATAYANSQATSYYVSGGGATKGEAALVRIRNGTMPQAAGCTGDPAVDAPFPSCLTAAEQATIADWIADGQLP